MDVVLDGERLRWGGREVPGSAVQGFHERYDALTGRAWLEVVGAGWRIPISSGYGPVRARLREAFPDRPFVADWMDGRFPAAPLGLPQDLVTALAGLVAVAAVVAAALLTGPWGALAVAVASAWPLVRLRDGVVVRKEGVRVGPPWAAITPWHEVVSVDVEVAGRRGKVGLVTASGGAVVGIPAVLAPALRARLRRLGALEPGDRADGLDAKYARWRAPATGIPWGILAGTPIAAAFSPDPWVALTAGLLAMAATAVLGSAVEARATGWGAGAVLWATLTYAIVLAAIGLGVGGWVTP
jgi:hypothetical protein